MLRILFILVLLAGVNFLARAQASATTSNVSGQAEEIEYSHYTIVVGSFTVSENAQKYARMVQEKGYELYLRRSEDGKWIRICVYTLKSKEEAYQRIEKMRHIDSLFQVCWVLGYNDEKDNLGLQ